MVSEIDCARVYSVSGQEMIRKLPDFLVNIYVSGSVSPGAELRLATEEFMKGSHRADEYIRRYLLECFSSKVGNRNSYSSIDAKITAAWPKQIRFHALIDSWISV